MAALANPADHQIHPAMTFDEFAAAMLTRAKEISTDAHGSKPEVQARKMLAKPPQHVGTEWERIERYTRALAQAVLAVRGETTAQGTKRPAPEDEQDPKRPRAE